MSPRPASVSPVNRSSDTFSDGSGRAVAVFTGRKRLGGVDCGRRIVVDGVIRVRPGNVVKPVPIAEAKGAGQPAAGQPAAGQPAAGAKP